MFYATHLSDFKTLLHMRVLLPTFRLAPIFRHFVPTVLFSNWSRGATVVVGGIVVVEVMTSARYFAYSTSNNDANG